MYSEQVVSRGTVHVLLTSTVRPCTSARTYLPTTTIVGSNQANHSLNFRQLRVVQYDLSRASDHRGHQLGRQQARPHEVAAPQTLGLEKAWMRNIGRQNRQSACKVQGRRRRGWYVRKKRRSVRAPIPNFRTSACRRRPTVVAITGRLRVVARSPLHHAKVRRKWRR